MKRGSPVWLNWLLLLALCPWLSACAPIVLAGTATGSLIAHDRRTVGTFIDDGGLEIKASRAIAADEELAKASHINVISYNNIILLTGETPTAAFRQAAADRVNPLPKVRQVYNEIAVREPISLWRRTHDTWLTAKIKALMLTNKKIDPTRFKITSSNGIVYVMGLVSHNEAKAATDLISHVAGVKKVINVFEYTDHNTDTAVG